MDRRVDTSKEKFLRAGLKVSYELVIDTLHKRLTKAPGILQDKGIIAIKHMRKGVSGLIFKEKILYQEVKVAKTNLHKRGVMKYKEYLK